MKLAIDLNDVHEAKPVPNGRYSLTIATAEETVSQKGAPQIKCYLGIDGHDDAPNVSHYISLPSPNDDADKAKYKALFLKRFLQLFKIPHTSEGFEIEDFFGATADAELTLSEPDDSGNVYNRLQLPRLADSDAGSKSTPKPPSAKR